MRLQTRPNRYLCIKIWSTEEFHKTAINHSRMTYLCMFSSVLVLSVPAEDIIDLPVLLFIGCACHFSLTRASDLTVSDFLCHKTIGVGFT